MKRFAVLAILAMCGFTCGYGQHSDNEVGIYRPVSAFYTIEAGNAHIVDTYLTPLRYSGWSARINYDRWQAMKFMPEKWTMNILSGINLDCTENPAGNATMWNLSLDFYWGMYSIWHLPLW
ncbi:MAG: DUF3316 domain-containing protein, partial [Muribaculaceae bacterium]|nr:DUF3316 domain-containing protein [Muribaculaceae bacterium]